MLRLHELISKYNLVKFNSLCVNHYFALNLGANVDLSKDIVRCRCPTLTANISQSQSNNSAANNNTHVASTLDENPNNDDEIDLDIDDDSSNSEFINSNTIHFLLNNKVKEHLPSLLNRLNSIDLSDTCNILVSTRGLRLLPWYVHYQHRPDALESLPIYLFQRRFVIKSIKKSAFSFRPSHPLHTTFGLSFATKPTVPSISIPIPSKTNSDADQVERHELITFLLFHPWRDPVKDYIRHRYQIGCIHCTKKTELATLNPSTLTQRQKLDLLLKNLSERFVRNTDALAVSKQEADNIAARRFIDTETLVMPSHLTDIIDVADFFFENADAPDAVLAEDLDKTFSLSEMSWDHEYDLFNQIEDETLKDFVFYSLRRARRFNRNQSSSAPHSNQRTFMLSPAMAVFRSTWKEDFGILNKRVQNRYADNANAITEDSFFNSYRQTTTQQAFTVAFRSIH